MERRQGMIGKRKKIRKSQWRTRVCGHTLQAEFRRKSNRKITQQNVVRPASIHHLLWIEKNLIQIKAHTDSLRRTCL